MKVRGDSLYIQTTLPPKPGSAATSPSRQVIATGLKDTTAGRKEFQRLVRKLEDQLDRGTFDWREWGWTPPSSRRDEVIERLRVQRASEISFDTWYNWTLFYRRLPEGPVTHEGLVRTLKKHWPIETSAYWRACVAFRALGKAALGEDFVLDVEKPHYSPTRAKPRDVPLDEEIEAAVDALAEPYRWMVGMLAACGLRPHELFHSQPDERRLLVGDDTKTGKRTVYPVLPEWWDRWSLQERRWPEEWNDLLTQEGRLRWLEERSSNQDLGSFETKGNCRWTRVLTHRLRWRKFPMTLYTLRHAYALRCMKTGVPTAIAAKMMGHSEHLHISTYRKWLSDAMVAEFMDRFSVGD